MMNTSRIERKEYEIECLSPVHIGNGTVLKAFEYLYDRKEQKVYFIDEGKWIRFLAHHDFLDSFSHYIQNIVTGKERRNVWQWLVDKNISDAELRGLGATVSALADTKRMKSSLNDIARTVTTAEGIPYIPGSSIKGILRTGILYHFIKSSRKLYNEEWQKFKNIILKNDSLNNKCKSDIVNLSSFIEKRIFEKLTKNETLDIMRGVLVSDAHCVQNIHSSLIVQKVDGTTKKNRNYKNEVPLPIYRECIQVGARLRCFISIDKQIMKEIGIFSISDILEMAKEFVQDGLEMQENVFGTRYSGAFSEAIRANIILGGGTGFLTKSILYGLAPSKEEGRKIVSKYLDLSFPNKKAPHSYNDREISPRTIKLGYIKNERKIMGLCHIYDIGEV